jgi:hypothetical protein
MPIKIVGTDFLDGDTLLIELTNGQAVVYSLDQLLTLEPILRVNQNAHYPSDGVE